MSTGLKHHRLCALIAGLAVGSSAHAQITAVFSNIQGAPSAQVPGIPNLIFTPGTNFSDVFRRPYNSADGTYWAITARASSAAGGSFRIVIIGGGTPTPVVIARQGADTPFDAQRIWSEFDEQVTINENGRVAFAATASGAASNNAVIALYHLNQFLSLPFREGLPVPGISGATYGPTLDSAAISESNTVACRALITGGGSDSTNNQILSIPSAVIARTGVTSPIGTSVKWENFTPRSFYYRSNGAYLVSGDLEGATNIDDILGFANLITVREGSVINGLTTPVAQRGIHGTSFGQDPSYIVRGQNTLRSEDWVVRNGALVARAAFTITPNNPVTEKFVSVGATPTFFAVNTNGAGDYLVGGFTTETNSNRDEVLVWNGDRVAMREGDPIDIDGDGHPDNFFIGGFRSDACIVKSGRAGVVYAVVEVRDSRGNLIGYAYVCTPIIPSSCTADFNGDGFVDGFDYDDFVSCFENNICPPGKTADINGDNFVDGFDYDDFVAAFEIGC